MLVRLATVAGLQLRVSLMSIATFASSPILAMARRAAELRASGRPIIDLTLGEPDFSPPEHVIAAAHEALSKRRLGYTPANGMPELRKAICESFERDYQLSYADNQIAVACGAKQIIFNALLASVEPGDEVVIAAPYWASYPDMVRACAGEPVIVPCQSQDGFRLTPGKLRAALSHRTRWLMLNAPGNPSGLVYSAAQLRELGEVLLDYPDVLVLSDDIYAPIRFDLTAHSERFATLAAVMPQLAARTLTVGGVSKAYAMTGWRVGWAGGPQWLISRMVAVQSQNCTQTATLSQIASTAALLGPQEFLSARNAIYQQRRDAALKVLRTCPQLSIHSPDGAFYLLPILKGKHSDGDAIAHDLLENHDLAVVPGSAFGVPNALRLSFATEASVLVEGCQRLVSYIGKLSQ